MVFKVFIAKLVSLSKKLYPHCLVLVGFRYGFKSYFTILLKYSIGLIED